MRYPLPDWLYDAIKKFVTVWLPAISVLYVGLAGIWGWPMADEVARTIAVVYTFLCAVMGISTAMGKEVDDASLLFAANLAASFSKAAASEQVPVDFTEIKNVKKPSGAKPGMVIYTTNRTIYAKPNISLVK